MFMCTRVYMQRVGIGAKQLHGWINCTAKDVMSHNFIVMRIRRIQKRTNSLIFWEKVVVGELSNMTPDKH